MNNNGSEQLAHNYFKTVYRDYKGFTFYTHDEMHRPVFLAWVEGDRGKWYRQYCRINYSYKRQYAEKYSDASRLIEQEIL